MIDVCALFQKEICRQVVQIVLQKQFDKGFVERTVRYVCHQPNLDNHEDGIGGIGCWPMVSAKIQVFEDVCF